MNTKKIYIVLLFIGLVFSSYSQTIDKKTKKTYEQACELINARKFYEGMDLLELVLKKQPDYMPALLKLGNAYNTMNMHNKHLIDIKRVYGQVSALEPDNPEYVSVYYQLAEIYLNEGSYALSKKYLEVIKKYPNQDKRISLNANYLANKVEFALDGIQNPLNFTAQKMPEETINRFALNSHPVLTANQKLMVVSVRNTIGYADENIVVSEWVDGAWTPTKNISSVINTPRNEGMQSISGDGRTLVFTSCNREDSKGGCDLYVSYKLGDDWTEPENLGDNINSYAKESEGALSADGRTLYFSSSRNNGYGLDLYMSKMDDDGQWQKCENMGPTINTKYNESTPFLHADGEHFYFASDGHLGFGGFDIFVSEIADGKFSEPINLGYPLNTEANEGSLYISPDYSKGYYEKYEKKASESRSFIYTFDFPEKIRGDFPVKYVEGRIFDAETKAFLSASIELTNISKDQRNQLTNSDASTGEYLVVLKEGEEYALHVEKKGYLFYSSNIDFTDKKSFDPYSLDVYLQPIKKGQEMVLANLFYATDKFELTPKSKTELLKLVKLLEDNPNLRIEISGHTDNQGSVSYNKTLSNNRAKAVYEYLVEKGIEASKLSYKGYGSLKPIADNTTAEGRMQNRRIALTVL